MGGGDVWPQNLKAKEDHTGLDRFELTVLHLAVRTADEASCRRLIGALPVQVGDQILDIVGAAEVEGDQQGRVTLPIAVQIAEGGAAGLNLGVGGLLQFRRLRASASARPRLRTVLRGPAADWRQPLQID
jgi:hypothetical protein